MEVQCRVCKALIPEERISFFVERGKGVDTCVKHSQEKAVKGYMVYPHKTGSVCTVVNPDDEETMRLAERAHRRDY